MANPYAGLYIDRTYLSALALIAPGHYAKVKDDQLAIIIGAHQDMVNSVLLKRYPVPYDPTKYVPPTIKHALAVLVFEHLRTAIGDVPSTQADRLTKAADQTRDFLRKAADSEEGYAELFVPTAEGAPGQSDVKRGGFMAITHRTPWAYQRSRRGR